MEKLNSMLASMTVFRGAAELPAVRALREALREARAGGDAERLLDAYGRALFGLRQEGADSFADYLRAHLLFDETPYALAVARGRADAAYRAAAERDLSILRALCALPAAQLKAAIAKIAGDELDFAKLSRLTFFEPDDVKFPLMNAARAMIRKGGTAPASLIAADEEAVDEFLNGGIGFTDISSVVLETLGKISVSFNISTDNIMAAVDEARLKCRETIGNYVKQRV